MALLWGFSADENKELAIYLEKGGRCLEIKKDDLVELFRAIRDFWRFTMSNGASLDDINEHSKKWNDDYQKMWGNTPELRWHGIEIVPTEVGCFFDHVVMYLRNVRRIESAKKKMGVIIEEMNLPITSEKVKDDKTCDCEDEVDSAWWPEFKTSVADKKWNYMSAGTAGGGQNIQLSFAAYLV